MGCRVLLVDAGSPPVTWKALNPGEREEALRRHEAKHGNEIPKSKVDAAGLVTLAILEKYNGALSEDLLRLRRRAAVDLQMLQVHLQQQYDDLLGALVECTTEFEKKLDSFESRLKALEERK